MNERPPLLAKIVEAFGLITAGSFVASCVFNAAIFDSAWGINYFQVASPQDVLMNGVMVLCLVVVVILSVIIVVHMAAIFLSENARLRDVRNALLTSGEAQVDTREYKYKPSFVQMRFRKYEEATRFNPFAIFLKPLFASFFAIFALVSFSIFINHFGSIFYFSTEEAIVRDVEAGRISRNEIAPLPIFRKIPKMGKLSREGLKVLRIKGHHYNPQEQFNYLTGLRVSSESSVPDFCKRAPILWLGGSSAVVACKTRIQVFHKLDPIISEPVG